MDPITGAAIIGAGSSLLGGALGRESLEDQQAKSLASQKEFAQHGIQWRVADAKAAGLHPLFALGASTSGPTIPVMDDPFAKSLAEAGQHVAGAVRATETPEQAEARKTALAVGASTIARNYAEAALFDSQAARNLQDSNSRPGMPSSRSGAGTLEPSPAQIVSGASPSAIQVVPSQTTAHAPNSPGVEAAAGTGMKWFNMPNGGRILLPAANSMSEALESASESYALMWVIARENMKQNPNFLRENAHWLPYGEELFRAYDKASSLWSDRMQRKHAADAPDISHGRAASPPRRYRSFRGGN